MNKIRFVIAIFSILIFSNCKKEAVICECNDACIPIEEITDDTTMIPTFFPGNQEFGSFRAVKVNQMVEGSVSAIRDTLNRNLNLEFRTYSTEGYPREELFISRIPFEVDCFGITKEAPAWVNLGYSNAVYLVRRGQGRLIDGIDDYTPNTVDEDINKIEITQIDTVEKIIIGNFAVSFELNNFEPIIPENPIFLRFFNGEFEVAYE